MPTCSFDLCDKPTKTAGLCSGHYAQKWRSKELRPLRATPQVLHVDVDNQERECRICHVVKSFVDFHKAAQSPGGVKAQCKPCDLQYQKDRQHFYKFGITPERFLEMLEEQGGGCATCLRTESGLRHWCIDHDHRCCPGRKSCGKCVRGILCSTCNTALGMMGDDPTVLRRGAEYLERQVQQ